MSGEPERMERLSRLIKALLVGIILSGTYLFFYWYVFSYDRKPKPSESNSQTNIFFMGGSSQTPIITLTNSTVQGKH
jgi:hypothetical protein